MGDVAQFGVKIVPDPAGRATVVADFERIEKSAAKAALTVEGGAAKTAKAMSGVAGAAATGTTAIEKHAGGLEKLAGAFARNSNGALSLLRSIGPLGGGAAELAERMERAALRVEKMTFSASQAVTQSQLLTKAHQEGSIAAATVEAATARLTQARQAAAVAEKAYADAQKAATEIAREQALVQRAIAEQSLVVRGARSNVAATASGLTPGQTIGANADQQRLIDAAAASTARLAQEEKYLIGLQQSGVQLTAEQRAASIAIRDAREAQAAATKEAAAAETLLNDAGEAGAAGIGATVAVIGGLIAVLVVAAAAIIAVEKAWHFLKSSIEEAKLAQTAQFQFAALIGNAQVAKEKFEELRDFWKSSGVFDLGDLAKGASALSLVGVGTDHLVERTKALAIASLASGETINGMASAYAKVQTAIQNQSTLMTRGISGTTVIMKALEAQSGETAGQIQQRFKTGKIQIDEVTAALVKAAGAGGIFGTVLADKLNTMDGQLLLLKTRWDVIKESFGAPIVDQLTPILKNISNWLANNEKDAAAAGKATADYLRILAGAASTGQVAHLMELEFKVAMDNINAYFENKFQELWKEILTIDWGAIADAITKPAAAAWQFLKDHASLAASGDESGLNVGGGTGVFAPGGAGQLGTGGGVDWGQDVLLGGDTDTQKRIQNLNDLQALKDKLLAAGPNPISGAGSGTGGGGGADLGITPLDKRHGGAGGAGKGFTEIKTDLDILNDYWSQLAQIEQRVTDPVEKQRREMELAITTSKELYNPQQFEPYIAGLGDQLTAMDKLIAAESERERKAKEADLAIANGSATLTQVLVRGLEKAKEAFGNWQQAAVKAISDISNALVNDISGGISDILDGTKSLKDGFRDMAISILKDIQRIIIQMLVELAVQRLLGAFGGGTSALAPNASTYIPAAHTGWNVGMEAPSMYRQVNPGMFSYAPRLHSGLMPDEYPAILQKGEQVIPRGGRGAGNTNVSVSVTYMDGKQTRSETTGDREEQARQLAKTVKKAIDDHLLDHRRHNGLLTNIR